MANFLGNPLVQYFKSGTVDYLAGGTLYAYDAGTMTPRYIYQTIDDAVAGVNGAYSATLDARGEAPVVLSGSTKLILKDADGATIWTADDVSAATTDIQDAYGEIILKFVGVLNALNYWEMTNAASGNGPILAANGGETNIPANISSKGSSALNLDGGSTGVINLGTTSTGQINLKRNTDITGTLTSSGASSLGGTSTNDDAAAGKIGEYIVSEIALGSAVSISSGSAATITSISLTAGDWEIDWSLHFGLYTNLTILRGGVSLTTNTLPTVTSANASTPSLSGYYRATTFTSSSAGQSISGSSCRQKLAATTTIYLVAGATFTGNCFASGWVSARRVR